MSLLRFTIIQLSFQVLFWVGCIGLVTNNSLSQKGTKIVLAFLVVSITNFLSQLLLIYKRQNPKITAWLYITSLKIIVIFVTLFIVFKPDIEALFDSRELFLCFTITFCCYFINFLHLFHSMRKINYNFSILP